MVLAIAMAWRQFKFLSLGINADLLNRATLLGLTPFAESFREIKYLSITANIVLFENKPGRGIQIYNSGPATLRLGHVML